MSTNHENGSPGPAGPSGRSRSEPAAAELPAPVTEPPVDSLDAVWKALANPWRRYLLDLLRGGPRTTGELAEACGAELGGLSRFAVMQHLEVLTEARLIIPRRSGRRRYNHLNPVPIQRIHERWVTAFEGHWASALVGLKQTLEKRDDGAETSSAAAG